MENIDLYKVMEIMDSINYGWIDINNKIHLNTTIDIQKLYRLSAIEEILKNKIGICFDQVELERYFFREHYKTSSYAIFTNHMVHSFLVLEKNDQFIYFEHSSFNNKGIYIFNNINDLLGYVVNCFIRDHRIKNIDKIKLVNYPEIKPMTTFDEIKEILLKGEEKEIKKAKI